MSTNFGSFTWYQKSRDTFPLLTLLKSDSLFHSALSLDFSVLSVSEAGKREMFLLDYGGVQLRERPPLACLSGQERMKGKKGLKNKEEGVA